MTGRHQAFCKSVNHFAANDTTYDFLTNRNECYLEQNLSGENFSNMGINFVALLDATGELVAARAVDLDWGVSVLSCATRILLVT